MPPLSQLPGELKRKKLTKALTRLGFSINTVGGKGDHIKVTWPSTGKSLTLPDEDLRKNVLNYLLKEIEAYSGITWDKIQQEL